MNNYTNVIRCSRCALPVTYPGLKLGDDNVCNYCEYFDTYCKQEKHMKKILKSKFTDIILATKKGNNKYDCIVAYSGGKDSTFLLHYLKKQYNLKILAHTFDNGFISKNTLLNIKQTIKTLRVEHRVTRPSFNVLKELFACSLRGEIAYPNEIRAVLSSVCAVCLGMVFGSTIKLAIKNKIPLMFIGFNPGQYPAISLENFLKVNSCMFLSNKIYKDDPIDIMKIIWDPINEKFGKTSEKYFFKSQYLNNRTKAPAVLFPFHALREYDEKSILKTISKYGWKRPPETDSCSTNCLLNSPGIISSLENEGYHPYIGELSLLVRTGKISYSEALGLERINHKSYAVEYSLKKLGLEITDLIR